MLRPVTTLWDRAAPGYLEEWVPRLAPYHTDFVTELCVHAGDRVLVVASGPGSEAVAVARVVGEEGFVRLVDSSRAMLDLCEARLAQAAVPCRTETVCAEPSDASGGPYHAVACAFGLLGLPDTGAALRAWRDALAESGKVGVMVWGPPAADDPYELFARVAVELEPDMHAACHHPGVVDRAGMAAMFEEAGMAMVRHTVVAHTLVFKRAEDFTRALLSSCAWRDELRAIGAARAAKISARFFEAVGGPDAPLTYRPPATIALAGLPGAQIELPHRPSVRIPAVSPS